MDEEEVGIVYVEETQDGGASYVLAINGEKLFFENRMEHNPYRGLGSMTKRYALNDDGTLEDRPRDLDSFASLPREDEERKLYFRLDEDGNGMSDNTTRLENVGIVFQAGTRVTYTRREPSQLKRFSHGGARAPKEVAMYNVSKDPYVGVLHLPDGFDAFAFRVKAV